MAKRGPTIADGALELIRQHGPQTAEELAPALVALGRTRAKDPGAAVRNAVAFNPGFVSGRGDRWFSLVDQLEGAIFTVRPTRFERKNEVVLVRSELWLLERLAMRNRRRADTDAVHLDFVGDYFNLPSWDVGIVDVDENGQVVMDPEFDLRGAIGPATAEGLLEFTEELGLPRGTHDDETLRDLLMELRFSWLLHGPPAWLPPLRPRELLGLRVEGGTVVAVAVDRRAASGIHAEIAARKLGIVLDSVFEVLAQEGLEPVVPMEDVLTLLVTETPDVFRRPLPPLGELIEDAGWSTDGGLIGPAGMAWDEFGDDDPPHEPWDDGPRLLH